jgi:hypothetical protein
MTIAFGFKRLRIYFKLIFFKSDSMLSKLGEKIEEVRKSIKKDDTGYNLDVLEKIGLECKEEGVFEEEEVSIPN